MNIKAGVDHTMKLELRLKAVHICAKDTCSFYSPKDGNVMNIPKCLYCKYARFQIDIIEEDALGLCKFKP